jgi:hypothetical protein
MALGMFGGMEQKTAYGGRQAGPAHIPDPGKSGFGSLRNLF